MMVRTPTRKRKIVRKRKPTKKKVNILRKDVNFKIKRYPDYYNILSDVLKYLRYVKGTVEWWHDEADYSGNQRTLLRLKGLEKDFTNFILPCFLFLVKSKTDYERKIYSFLLGEIIKIIDGVKSFTIEGFEENMKIMRDIKNIENRLIFDISRFLIS